MIMWALSQSAKYTRNFSHHVLISQASLAHSRVPNSSVEYAGGTYGREQCNAGGSAFSKAYAREPSSFSNCLLGCRSLSSITGQKIANSEHNVASSNQEYVENDKIGFSVHKELELASEVLLESNLYIDSSEIAHNSSDLSDTEMVSPGEAGSTDCCPPVPLYKVLMEAPFLSIDDVLEKWLEDGNTLDRGEVSITMLNLQMRRLYGKALKFWEWLEARRCLSFVDYDYASQLDLVAKVHGLQKAEMFIENIPESFKGEVVYRTFLANCVSALNVRKAEEAFNKIRELELPITTFSFDQMLLLYKKVGIKKVADVLSLMEKESIKPSLFTYKLLIDIKGSLLDIAGMEQIVKKMKAEKLEPDLVIKSMVIGFYIFGGLTDKAEAALKEMEGEDINKNRDACEVLIHLYAALNKAADLERVWRACKANPRLGECAAAIEAWGKLGDAEKAEEVFAISLKLWGKRSKCYDALLKVYVDHKLLAKGEDLVQVMKQNECSFSPSTWYMIVKLYVEAGEVEKAGSILQVDDTKSKLRPLHGAHIVLLKEYSKRGDIHNAEKIFLKLRESGYMRRIKLYHLLLEAYLNAKTPAYGFRERMVADNIFPNKQLAQKLAAVDALCKPLVAQSDELDTDLRLSLFKTT